MRRRLAPLLAVAAIGALGLTGGGAQANTPGLRGSASASKTCGHGAPAQTPGGVKCLAPRGVLLAQALLPGCLQKCRLQVRRRRAASGTVMNPRSRT